MSNQDETARRDKSSHGDKITQNLNLLRTILREMGSVLVCYSGGIDSALVLAVAHQELGSSKAIGLTAVSPSLPSAEKDAAETLARQLGATHRLVSSHEIQRPDYVKNGPDRCFHCKSELYDIAQLKAKEWGLSVITNGTNLDDLGDYRPGLKAAEDALVRSPLCEAKLNKKDVRALAQILGLPIWDKPASACLASRIPYGTAVTPSRLRQIEQVEQALHTLGFSQVRVRHHEEVARIEVPREDMARIFEPQISELIESAGHAAGFRYVTIDLKGYRTGSLNEALPSAVLQNKSLPIVS